MVEQEKIAKKYHRKIVQGTRVKVITLSPHFLEERNLSLGDIVDIRTMTKVE